jgi:hypothetical protein
VISFCVAMDGEFRAAESIRGEFRGVPFDGGDGWRFLHMRFLLSEQSRYYPYRPVI